MARKKKEIDYETVKKLANIQCTQDEIASFLGICVRTLQRDEKAMEAYKNGIETGKASLRRIQWKHAEKSASMAIFLGKQYLGQRDNQDIMIGKNPIEDLTPLAELLKGEKNESRTNN